MTNLFKITGTVTLKKGAGRQLKSGGMWVYDNEIDTFSETVEDGGLIELHDFDDYFMGIGFVNRRSKITVRMLSRHEGEINEEFIKQRVKDAVSYRMDTVDTSSCRLIFGEADFLPGIVIDKFSDVLVVESLALGITNLVKKGYLTLEELLTKMTVNPAKLYKMDKGCIEAGKIADLVIFNPDEEWEVTENFVSKASNSPFIGQKLYGKIKYTICNGNVVYKDLK